MIQIEQQSIDTRIGQGIMLAMPATWRGAQLIAERDTQGGTESYKITISALQHEPGVALPSDELQAAIRELFLLHKRHATGLRLAKYIVDPDGSGWKLVSEFEYDD